MSKRDIIYFLHSSMLSSISLLTKCILPVIIHNIKGDDEEEYAYFPMLREKTVGASLCRECAEGSLGASAVNFYFM